MIQAMVKMKLFFLKSLFKPSFTTLFCASLFGMEDINPPFFKDGFNLNCLPKKYSEDELTRKAYVLFKGSAQPEKAVDVMQLVKKLATLQFPKEIIVKILNYSVTSSFFIAKHHYMECMNLEKIRTDAINSALKAPIVGLSMKAYLNNNKRQKMNWVGATNAEISEYEPDFLSLMAQNIAVSITVQTGQEITKESLQDLKNNGLIFHEDLLSLLPLQEFNANFLLTNAQREIVNQENKTTRYCLNSSQKTTYAWYKYFNANPRYSLSIENRYANYGIIYEGTDNEEYGGENREKCILKIYDRTKQIDGKLDERMISFDDYIGSCFCSNNMLFIELMEKRIFASGHGSQIQSRKNHRIVIYDLITETPLNSLPIPLFKAPNHLILYPMYELAYVDDQNIYLHDIQKNRIVALRYYGSEQILNEKLPFSTTDEDFAALQKEPNNSIDTEIIVVNSKSSNIWLRVKSMMRSAKYYSCALLFLVGITLLVPRSSSKNIFNAIVKD
jgi:hypothetical protein